MSYGVSLICRDEEENIESCIDSIFKQSIKPLKVVVIDDGSKDSTPQILYKKTLQHPELYYTSIKRPRLGFKGWNISEAINISLVEQTL